MPRKPQRLRPAQILELKDQLAALKNMTDYDPRKPEYEVAEIERVDTEMDALRNQEAQLEAQLKDVRDRAAAKENELQQKMIGATQQVIAQYGSDSAELQSLGRVRKSERAAPKPRRTTNDSPNR